MSGTIEIQFNFYPAGKKVLAPRLVIERWPIEKIGKDKSGRDWAIVATPGGPLLFNQNMKIDGSRGRLSTIYTVESFLQFVKRQATTSNADLIRVYRIEGRGLARWSFNHNENDTILSPIASVITIDDRTYLPVWLVKKSFRRLDDLSCRVTAWPGHKKILDRLVFLQNDFIQSSDYIAEINKLAERKQASNLARAAENLEAQNKKSEEQKKREARAAIERSRVENRIFSADQFDENVTVVWPNYDYKKRTVHEPTSFKGANVILKGQRVYVQYEGEEYIKSIETKGFMINDLKASDYFSRNTVRKTPKLAANF